MFRQNGPKRAEIVSKTAEEAATKEQLLSLPGITSAEANRVIAGRPYSDPSELVKRRIMSKVEYDKIADRVTAGK